MPVRLGIIGLSANKTAWATAAHAAPLKSPALADKYKITAIATSSPESAKAAANFHGVPEDKAYHSAEAIAKDPDVDMVVVSVKLPLHKELTIPALNARKPVLVEWPMGNGLKEAEEMAALAKKQGVKTAVGLQARLSPAVQKAKEIIDSGALGRILSTTVVASSSIGQTLPEKNSYVNDPTNDANLISIAAIHTIDPLCYLLSEFTSLTATTTTVFPTISFLTSSGTFTPPTPRTFVDTMLIQGPLQSGAVASFALVSTTDATPMSLSWMINGEKGSLKFEGEAPFITLSQPRLYQYTPSGEQKYEGYQQVGEKTAWEEVEVGKPMAFGGIGELYEAFAQGGEGKGVDYVDFEEAVKRHRMVEAIRRSAEKGTRESYL